MQSDDERLDALRRVYREASAQVDDRPSTSVRATVLAAAAREVDARPRLSGRGPFPARRWPMSAAALLVVSLMTGLVATHVMRDRPERITTVASSTPEARSVERAAPAPESPAARAMATDPVGRLADRPVVAPSRSAARKPSPPKRDVEPVTPPPPPSSSESASSGFLAPPVASPAAPLFERRAKASDDAADAAGNAAPATTREVPSQRATREDPPQTLRAKSSRSRIASVPEPSTPEAWIERIVKLRADGNDIDADREVEALRRRYPGFAIPANALRPIGTH